MKLKEAFDLYLRVDRAEQTQITYRKVLTRLITEIGPGRPLELVTPEDLDAYVYDLQNRRVKYADHPRRPVEKAPLSAATVAKHVRTIRAFFNWCVKRGYLAQSPTRFLTLRRSARPLGKGKAATADEVDAVLTVARFKTRDWAVALLLAQSGCRANEVAGLRISHLDLEEYNAVVDGKGDKRHVIVFGPESAEAIRAWLAIRPVDADHDCVFTSTHGHGPLTARAVSQIIRRLCRVAGIRSLGAHSLRHFVGMTLAREQIAPPIIKEYIWGIRLSVPQ